MPGERSRDNTSILEIEKIKPFLDEAYLKYNDPGFIDEDPISIPHLFTKKEDREISGFLTAIISWGNRKSILNSARKLLQWMDYDPSAFIHAFEDQDLKPFTEFVHRTFNGDDCIYFLHALKNIYLNYGGLERLIEGENGDTDLVSNLIRFREVFFSIPHLHRTRKHVADPLKNASMKRINMFLRWMVRKDDMGVDFGIWQSIDQSKLLCPLDVHSGMVARKLKLLSRKQNDLKAVKELTENLKLLDPADPVKYDFALFGIGIHEKHSW